MDPATQAVMEALTAAFPQVETMTGAEARAAVGALPRPAAVTEVGTVTDLGIPNGDSEIGARVYRPATGARTPPGVVFFHGGGFVVGDLDTYDGAARAMCAALGAVVVSVDYRLAPENSFPAAVEDASAALRWVARSVDSLGVDPARLMVAGDSAGGNLAAVVALLARDAGIPLAHQLLVYPMLDPDRGGESHRRNADGCFLTEAAVAWYWAQYLAGDVRDDWRVTPLRAPDLLGVAPATIVVAEYDPVLDDGLAYADALRVAGVPVEVVRADGLFHGFFGVAGVLPLAAETRAAAFASVLRGLPSVRPSKSLT